VHTASLNHVPATDYEANSTQPQHSSNPSSHLFQGGCIRAKPERRLLLDQRQQLPSDRVCRLQLLSRGGVVAAVEAEDGLLG